MNYVEFSSDLFVDAFIATMRDTGSAKHFDASCQHLVSTLNLRIARTDFDARQFP
jgi:hypothetical protein